MVIDAKEKRDVATADVVGAYLNADMPDFVVLKLVGSAVDIMCMVNPKYKKFVTHENGKRHQGYELSHDLKPKKIDTCLMIPRAIAMQSKLDDSSVLMLLIKIQEYYKKTQYTKVIVNVTSFFACSEQSDQIKLNKKDLTKLCLKMLVRSKKFVEGKTAQVSPFTPDYDSMTDVPIVDAANAYDCPITLKTYIIVCHNALYVPAMDHNLVPPFIL
eukprot:scaffold1521_cov271-Chaetoceros_neogracile.AAC.57